MSLSASRSAHPSARNRSADATDLWRPAGGRIEIPCRRSSSARLPARRRYPMSSTVWPEHGLGKEVDLLGHLGGGVHAERRGRQVIDAERVELLELLEDDLRASDQVVAHRDV